MAILFTLFDVRAITRLYTLACVYDGVICTSPPKGSRINVLYENIHEAYLKSKVGVWPGLVGQILEIGLL